MFKEIPVRDVAFGGRIRNILNNYCKEEITYDYLKEGLLLLIIKTHGESLLDDRTFISRSPLREKHDD